MIDIASIQTAREHLRGQVLKTPFTLSRTLSDIFGAEIWLKFENLQFTASFKERGALNRMLSLSDEERAKGLSRCPPATMRKAWPTMRSAWAYRP